MHLFVCRQKATMSQGLKAGFDCHWFLVGPALAASLEICETCHSFFANFMRTYVAFTECKPLYETMVTDNNGTTLDNHSSPLPLLLVIGLR